MPLYTPVVAFLAELLFEVTQGKTVTLHGPPVRNLLSTEEICHHRLPTAPTVTSYNLLTPVRTQRDRNGVKEGMDP